MYPSGQNAAPYPPNQNPNYGQNPYPAQGNSPYPPPGPNSVQYPTGQPNFNQGSAGMWQPQGQQNAYPPQDGFAPIGQQQQWTANASSAPPVPTQGGAGDIGFNFHGSSLPGYIDSSLAPTIQPPTNPYFMDGKDQGEFQTDESRPLLPAAAAATEDEIRTALEKYADKKFCRGKLEGITFDDIKMKSGFKYNLTSSTEKRETVWEFEPYTTQKMDGPSGGPLPGPWDLEVHPSSSFSVGKKEIHIPGTSSIKPCHSCVGNGNTRCSTCTGMGGVKCTWCDGSGTRMSEQCKDCTGTGRSRCTKCTGTGMETCKTCKGKRQLFTYLKLIVKWDILKDDFASAETAIPSKYLTKKCSGIEVVNEKGSRVRPIANFPDEAINTTSQNLIDKQLKAVMPNGAIREQKQSVEMIRIAEVKYNWKDKSGNFYMFGVDNYIYFPDYPKSCCGCCTIS